MNIVLLAMNADPQLLIDRGIVGIPGGWILELHAWDGVSEIPFEWQVMSDEQARLQYSNFEAAYKTWIASRIDPVVRVSAAIEDAMRFGRGIIAQFGAENVIRGMSPSQIAQISGMLLQLTLLLQTGSLHTALAAMQGLKPDGVLLTAALKKKYVNKIQTYLGVALT